MSLPNFLSIWNLAVVTSLISLSAKCNICFNSCQSRSIYFLLTLGHIFGPLYSWRIGSRISADMNIHGTRVPYLNFHIQKCENHVYRGPVACFCFSAFLEIFYLIQTLWILHPCVLDNYIFLEILLSCILGHNFVFGNNVIFL